MPRPDNSSDWYLPLFAGTELLRRSGALTTFPVGDLLGNLPETPPEAPPEIPE